MKQLFLLTTMLMTFGLVSAQLISDKGQILTVMFV